MAPRSRMPSFSQQLCRLHSSITVINTTILCCHDMTCSIIRSCVRLLFGRLGRHAPPPLILDTLANDDTCHSIHGSSQAPAVAL